MPEDPKKQNNDNGGPGGLEPQEPGRGMSNSYKYFVFFLIAIFLIPVLTNLFVGRQDANQISYSRFREEVRNGNVSQVVVSGDRIEGTFRGQEDADAEFVTFLPSFGDPQLLDMLEEQNVQVRTEPEQDYNLLGLLLNFLPIIIFVWIGIILFRSMRQQGRGLFQMNQNKAKLYKKTKESITFDDVAGVAAAKDEIKEIVDYLKHPERYQELDAVTPRGVLLVGPPGTGKTLIARAIAGEADVPFYSMSGSDFMEMFVGVGASRVRKLFEEAKRNSPSIIFIDELDSVGRHRGAGLGGGHDEREQTLNQMLSEMDGFEKDTSVIIIAATNRPDILDPALLRPGRFDRQVTIGLPTMREREEILKVHVRNKPIDDEVDLHRLAESTPMFSGADLENLTNEAALIAARSNKHVISWSDFNEALDRITLGLRRGSLVPTEQERKLLAFHEAGHAVAYAAQPELGEIRKVTISPRGGAGGFMAPLSKEEMFFDQSRFLAQLVVAFGGRVAEKRITGTISSGASNDLKQATELAKQMVLDMGMGGEEYVAWGSDAGPVFLGGEISRRKDFSEETARQLEEQVTAILKDSYQRTHELIEAHWPAVEAVARALLRVETVDGKLVAEAYRRAEAGEDTEEIVDWIVNAVEEQERRILEANEKQKAKAEERARDEAARSAPPTTSPPSRPATEGSGN